MDWIKIENQKIPTGKKLFYKLQTGQIIGPFEYSENFAKALVSPITHYATHNTVY